MGVNIDETILMLVDTGASRRYTPSNVRDWSAFDDFTRPVETNLMSWVGVNEWAAAIEKHLGVERDWLGQRRAQSDELLADLGGDPTASDWTSFLPLRRDREEDWSDWLAQLLMESNTGQLAVALFGSFEGRGPESYVRPDIHREVLHEGYRADLVIQWPDSSYTHVEVKVGDPNLGKTFETAHKMQRRFTSLARRSDVVLLLPTQEDAWSAACGVQPGMHDRVHCLSWHHVAKALRRALPLDVGESTRWRVWAHAFCGAIEQDLLQVSSCTAAAQWPRSLSLHGLRVAVALFR
ncbi:MAG: hypothetical protein IPL75_09820 [Acidobacteria bacterium]|nr:hypothetical protein [Acidobacteriota bacterium]